MLGMVLAVGINVARALDDPTLIQPIISDIQVSIESVPGEGKNLDLLPAHLIFLKKGQPFSSQRLEESIRALKMSQRFEQIDIDSSEKERTIALTFRLVPFRLIYDIQVRGEYPLFERDVLNALTVQPGDPYKHVALPKQAELIATVFKRQGYPDAKVEITGRPRSNDGFIELVISIDKGAFLELADIFVTGNEAIEKKRILRQFTTWWKRLLPGGQGRFIERTFMDDLESLKLFYRKQGFYGVRISDKLTPNLADATISANLTIAEGPRYTVEFTGNDQLSNRRLEKVLLPDLSGYIGPSTFKRGVRELRRLYQSEGFIEAEIDIERTDTKQDGLPARHIRIDITEGPRTLVGSVSVVGNQGIPTQTILADVLTQPPALLKPGIFDPNTLKQDLAALQQLYLQHGYLTATIEERLVFSNDGQQVDVTIEIEEGPRTVVADVIFPAGMPISKAEALDAITLKPGAAFRDTMLVSDQNTVEGLIADLGYPHADVAVQTQLSDDQRRITLTYTVDSGPYVTLGEIFYRGNFRTKRRVLNRALEFKPGHPFSLTKALDTQRTLRDIVALSAVRFDTFGLAVRSQKVFIFAEVVERKPYFIEMGGGYQSDKGFFALARAGDLNIKGRNKSLQLGGQISQVGHRLELDFIEPRLFNHPTRANLTAFWDREEEFNQVFGTEVVGTALGVTRTYWESFDVGLKQQFEYRDQFMQAGETRPPDIEPDEFDPRAVMITTPALRYDTRDSIIQPRKGFLFGAGIDINKGLENSLDDFLRYQFDAHYYYSPFKRLTLAAVARTGLIDPYGDNANVPSDQLFYLGGTLNVRGYGENELLLDSEEKPVGGRRAISGSVEARFALLQSFELALFYDIGQLALTEEPVTPERFRDSIGAGLRYLNAIGPIGFMYGHKLDPQPGEASGCWHFSIGYTF
jgi:outer membrane protein insertion porin family